MEEKKEDPDKLRKKSEIQGEEPKEHVKEESAGPSKKKLSNSSDEETERVRKRVKSSVTDQVRDPGRKRCRTREDEDQAGCKRVKMPSHRKLGLQAERKSDEKEQQSRGQKHSRESDEENESERQKMAKPSSSRKSPHQKEQKADQTPSPRKRGQKRLTDSDQDEEEEQETLKKVKITSSEKHDKEVKSNKNVEQDTPKCGPSRMLVRKCSRESDEEEEHRAQKIAKVASEKSNEEEKAEEKQFEKNNEPSSDHSVAGGSGQIVASSTSLSQSLSDYEFQKLLGFGSFGKVMLASHKNTNHLVAIKIICNERVKETSIQKEQRILLQMAQESPFLCHGLTAFHTPGKTFLVMEYIQGGSLHSFMAQKGLLSITESRFIGAELICGIQFLHSHGIIHRDLKPENVLLDDDGHVKIADFGLAAENIFGSTKVKGSYGTLQYMAPEVLCNVPYGVSADWWSFGVILCHMITGQHPFQDDMLDRILLKVVTSGPCYPDWLSSDSMDLLNGLLRKEADSRLGVNGSVREHAFFKDVDWEELESCKASPPFLMFNK